MHSDIDGYFFSWGSWDNKPTKNDILNILRFYDFGSMPEYEIAKDLVDNGECYVGDESCTVFSLLGPT